MKISRTFVPRRMGRCGFDGGPGPAGSCGRPPIAGGRIRQADRAGGAARSPVELTPGVPSKAFVDSYA
jgi:hypothetical protein